MPTNDHNPNATQPHGSGPENTELPGYETTDVNVNGVAVFLAGLFGSVLLFFGVCFMLGRIINSEFVKQDGPVDKWHQLPLTGSQAAPAGQKLQNLASSPEMQQRESQQVTSNFPTPRLEIDDGNQSVADLHAREDLLLDHYSSVPGATGGEIRIPIDRAMELIVQRGLPLNTAPDAALSASVQMAGDVKPQVRMPLTNGFARTGYELDVRETRAQKMSYSKAEAGTRAEPHAGLPPEPAPLNERTGQHQ